MSEAVGTDPYQRARGEIIPERNKVVPPWAKTIRDFSVTVKELVDGTPQEIPPGFTIGEVAPEYRWAVDADTGVIMDQATFQLQFEKWYNAHYTMRGAQVEGEPVNIPTVKSFVSRKVDPDHPSKVVPMTYDPNRPVLSKPRLMYDRDGENPISPEEAMARQKSDKAGAQMEMLVKMHSDGILTDAQFAEQSKKVFGGSVVVGDEGADSSGPAAVEPPPGFSPKADAPPPQEQSEPDTVTTLCGKEVKVRGKHVHERQCAECKHIRELAETAENIESESSQEE